MPVAKLIQQHRIRLGEFNDREVRMTFNRIPACADGFLMGSRSEFAREEPVHRVVIDDDFWMGETPVTVEQFNAWSTSKDKTRETANPNHPAHEITWNQARDYCAWLTKSLGGTFPDGFELATLPTEAHWEYACRAGTRTVYSSGDGESALWEAGWFFGNSEGSAQPVGKLAPNDFGLFDMHGNVWEWCGDRWDESAYRRRWNGITAEETFLLNEKHGDQNESDTDIGESRVLRGGSWFNSAVRCRAAYRGRDGAGISNGIGGFRVCLVRSPIDQSSGPAEP